MVILASHEVSLPLTQDNSLERAADWVFSHAGELEAMEVDQPQPSQGEEYHDGPGSEGTMTTLF